MTPQRKKTGAGAPSRIHVEDEGRRSWRAAWITTSDYYRATRRPCTVVQVHPVMSQGGFNKTARTLIDTYVSLARHIDREIASKLSVLEMTGSHRRFLVARQGSTGSTWLAKLINSHPDV